MGVLSIPVRVTDEKELYDPFDPTGLSLSSALSSYLQDALEDRRIGKSVALELYTSLDIDIERFSKAYSAFIEKLVDRNRRSRIRERLNAMRLLGIGISFILIGIFFSSCMDQVVAAIISTIGSFAVWEASAVWIQVLPRMRVKERILESMAKAEIRRVYP